VKTPVLVLACIARNPLMKWKIRGPLSFPVNYRRHINVSQEISSMDKIGESIYGAEVNEFSRKPCRLYKSSISEGCDDGRRGAMYDSAEGRRLLQSTVGTPWLGCILEYESAGKIS